MSLVPQRYLLQRCLPQRCLPQCCLPQCCLPKRWLPRRWLGACFALAAFAVPPAHAQENLSTTTAAPPASAVDSTRGARSVVDVAEDAAAHGDLATSIATTPGTDLRRTGGPGSPVQISVRGAAPWHTRLVLDGILLDGGGGTPFDLALLPARFLQRVTVHRGIAPLAFGAPAAGGTVHLETRFLPDTRALVRAGTGSFGARQAGGVWQHATERSEWLAGLQYDGAQANFPFYDDRSTVFDTSDDRPDARRRNAGWDRVSGLVRHRARAGRWRTTTLALGTWQRNGLPGLAAAPTREARRSRSQLLAGLRAQRSRLWRDRLDLELLLSTRVGVDRLYDPDAEVGLVRRERVDLLHETRVAALPRLALHPRADLQLLVEAAAETYGVRERKDPPPVDGALRLRGAVGGTLLTRVIPNWLSAEGGARIDAWWSRVEGDPTVSGAGGADEDRALPSAWAGIVVERPLLSGLTLRVSGTAQATARAPSFLELYGDRGDTVGNPRLRAERQRGYEVGGAANWRADDDADDAGAAAGLEWAFFDRSIDRLIVATESGLGVTVPRNVGTAALRGHEVAFHGRVGPLDAYAAWTLLDALDRSPGSQTFNYRLPRRPVHTAHTSLGWRIGWVHLRWMADFASPFYLDTRERRAMPARFENHVRARASFDVLGGLDAVLEVRNLADRRTARVDLPDGGRTVSRPRAIADYLGQPLPGRAVHAAIELRIPHEVP